MQDEPPCTGTAKPAATIEPATAQAPQPRATRSRAASVGALLVGAVPALLRGLRRVLHGFLILPRGHTPVPTVASLLILALIIVFAVELLPKSISDVTLSVRARTEVVELELDPQREYTWWVPAGNYSLLTAKAGSGCETRNRFDVACSYTGSTAITIKRGATVRLETLPAMDAESGPRFSVGITPRKPAASAKPAADEGSHFEIRNLADELLIDTRDLVTFESAPVDLWRVPLILKHVQIGESLSESIAADDTLGAVRQPIMTSGDVRIFARSFLMSDRYQIQQEQFDPADVVQIPGEARRDGLLLGLISLGTGDRAFDLTLHTDLAEVFVRRLGAGHRIGVSMWSIMSQLPLWLALWVVLGSLILVANYHATRLSSSSRPH